ncbi:MAG: ribose 5-phosphate isomerase B [Coriobacteriales bacterium]|jgi:ribose 5-phosphate isomerase B|nr:ribose 5-phosphate isomerase B [Coriobacteriales bacterium]
MEHSPASDSPTGGDSTDNTSFANSPVAIASDHAGFEQKQQLAAWLEECGLEVQDLGPSNDERVDYPDYAALVAREVVAGRAAFGVLVCGTGIGMAIAANKLEGIRAANVTSPRFAALAREHNDANVIALSGRFVDLETNKRTLTAFLSRPFGEGRHAERVKKIRGLEQKPASHSG